MELMGKYLRYLKIFIYLKRGKFRERKISRFRDFFHNSRNLKTLEVSIREILFSRNPLNSSIREIKLSRNRIFFSNFSRFSKLASSKTVTRGWGWHSHKKTRSGKEKQTRLTCLISYLIRLVDLYDY